MLKFLFVILMFFVPTEARPHGGVVLEEDICLIKVGFYEAHFTIFQPNSRQHQQFCEDLPDTGESIFVLEYLHDGLEELAVDFRIIRNTTGNGIFANQEDLENIDDLEELTVFYQPPVKDPDVFAVLYDFKKRGEFIGIVTAEDNNSNKTYKAVFPFETGFTSSDIGDIAKFIVVPSIFLSWLIYFLYRRKKIQAVPSVVAIVIFFMLPDTLWASTFSQANEQAVITGASQSFVALAEPSLNPITINEIHSWTVLIETTAGATVSGAQILVGGGMPLHDHGMQTEPRVTDNPDSGVYVIGGMKFHMRGYWEVELKISYRGKTETLNLGFNL